MAVSGTWSRLRIALLAALAAALIAPAASPAKRITKPRWIRSVLITEYFPTPESWFNGKRVLAPGLRTKHRVDWLYSALGLPMEGSGIGLDGKRYHIARTGHQGWVDRKGHRTNVGGGGRGRGPFWWGGGWRNARGAVTYPLEAGGWFNGKSKRYIRPRGVSFGTGEPLPLRYWRSLAVDPSYIPLGSQVYIPAYKSKPGGGWFRAADTGGAIDGRHVDVFRPPPSRPGGEVTRSGQRIFVVPPGRRRPPSAPSPNGGLPRR